MTPSDLSPTPRSTIQRGRNRAVTDRAVLHSVLDAGLICHLAVVVDGAPVVLPTGYGRDGDTLYLHGSTGARSLRLLADGAPACVSVTLLDGVVYARSVFHNSVNYRSAVIHGQLVPVTEDAAKLHGLRVLTEHLAPGSWQRVRQPDRRELAATMVLALDLTEASVKVRAEGPVDDERDLDSPVWAGVLPLRRVWGEPQPCARLAPGTTTPVEVAMRGQPG